MPVLLLSPHRALPAPAHPAGGAPRQHLGRGGRRCRVRLQGLQRCPAPHPVDQARGEERQQIRARWAALPPGFKGEASQMLPGVMPDLERGSEFIWCESKDFEI